MPFSNSTAARYGQLAMHAMDMYRVGCGLTPVPAPGLTKAGWEVVAYLKGNDTVLRDGKITTAPNIVNYGFVARRAAKGDDDPGEIAIVIRGTDGLIEWIEDAEFVSIDYRPSTPISSAAPLRVEFGFWALYESLSLVEPKDEASLVAGIAALRSGAETVTVVGHSLGAALATYLAVDLARAIDGVQACLLASPHTGNAAFTAFFDATVREYRLFNYVLDVVPKVPFGPDYARLPRCTVLTPHTAEAHIRLGLGCSHHVVCYSAMLDFEGTMAAITPVPDGEQGSAACILGPETGAPSLAKLLIASVAENA